MLPKLLNKIEIEDICIETFPIGTLACNCSLIYSMQTKDAVIIDPGNDAPGLLALVKERNLRVKSLVHTHAHFDHIGRSNTIKNCLGAEIYLHKDDLFLYEALRHQGQLFGEPVDEPMPLDHYIEDGQEFYLQKDRQAINIFSALHTPGHTPGSCCFHLSSTVKPIVFSGDTLFNNSIGRTDLPGGDAELILSSIKNRLLSLEDETICIPGHGSLTSIKEQRSSNPFL